MTACQSKTNNFFQNFLAAFNSSFIEVQESPKKAVHKNICLAKILHFLKKVNFQNFCIFGNSKSSGLERFPSLNMIQHDYLSKFKAKTNACKLETDSKFRLLKFEFSPPKLMFFYCHHQIVGQTENQSKRERYPMFFIQALPLFLLKHGSTHQRIEMFPFKMDTLL